MVRVDPASSDSLVATTRAHLLEMRGRPMQGWLRVDTGDVRTKRQLAEWVQLGAAYARSLPLKPMIDAPRSSGPLSVSPGVAWVGSVRLSTSRLPGDHLDGRGDG